MNEQLALAVRGTAADIRGVEADQVARDADDLGQGRIGHEPRLSKRRGAPGRRRRFLTASELVLM